MENLRKLNRRINLANQYAQIIRGNVSAMYVLTGEDFNDWDEIERLEILCKAVRASAWNIHDLCGYIEGAITAQKNKLMEKDAEEVQGNATPWPTDGSEQEE